MRKKRELGIETNMAFLERLIILFVSKYYLNGVLNKLNLVSLIISLNESILSLNIGFS